MEEESWRRIPGRGMWERNHVGIMGGIMREESWERNHGGGSMEEKSWKRTLGGGIMVEESWRRHLGGIWEPSGSHLGQDMLWE